MNETPHTTGVPTAAIEGAAEPRPAAGTARPGLQKILVENRRMVFYYLLVALLVLSMVLTYVWSFVKVSEARRLVRELERANDNLRRRHEQLQLDRSHLSNPARIESIAKKELGMSLPRHVEYLEILIDTNGVDLTRDAAPPGASASESSR